MRMQLLVSINYNGTCNIFTTFNELHKFTYPPYMFVREAFSDAHARAKQRTLHSACTLEAFDVATLQFTHHFVFNDITNHTYKLPHNIQDGQIEPPQQQCLVTHITHIILLLYTAIQLPMLHRVSTAVLIVVALGMSHRGGGKTAVIPGYAEHCSAVAHNTCTKGWAWTPDHLANASSVTRCRQNAIMNVSVHLH